MEDSYLLAGLQVLMELAFFLQFKTMPRDGTTHSGLDLLITGMNQDNPTQTCPPALTGLGNSSVKTFLSHDSTLCQVDN